MSHWTERALCAQIDPDLWFPEPTGLGPLMARQARAVCARCPVQAECLDAGAGSMGIWGGRTGKERGVE